MLSKTKKSKARKKEEKDSKNENKEETLLFSSMKRKITKSLHERIVSSIRLLDYPIETQGSI